MDLFKPEDFSIEYMGVELPDAFPELIAEKANELLNKRGYKVYSGILPLGSNPIWHRTRKPDYVLCALVSCIEELPKKECEHELEDSIPLPDYMRANTDVLSELRSLGNCKHCGIKMKAKWGPCD